MGPARRAGTDEEADIPGDPAAASAAVRQHAQGPKALERDAAQHPAAGIARCQAEWGPGQPRIGPSGQWVPEDWSAQAFEDAPPTPLAGGGTTPKMRQW